MPDQNTLTVAERLAMEDVIVAVRDERDRQVAKWGTEHYLLLDNFDGKIVEYTRHKMVVLGEEFGEACKDAIEREIEHLRIELIQCAAVAVATVEGINEWLRARA